MVFCNGYFLRQKRYATSIPIPVYIFANKMDWDDMFNDDCSDRRATISSFDSKAAGSKGFGSSRRSSALFRPDKRMKGEATTALDSVALSESPLVKSKSAQDGFEGFSIVKNRVPSAMNSPFTKGDILFRSLHSRERSSSNGRAFAATTPHSPMEFHTPMSISQRGDSELLASTISNLREEASARDAQVAQLKKELETARTATTVAQEDANATRFMCSLQEQRIMELEVKQSSDRMDMNEALSQKSRKHRAAVKKLQQERAAYEERADSMIAQMTEQMTQLQKMAMARIESLEKELMAQRHSNDQLQVECTRLHTCAAAAIASATKHRQHAAASSKLSSPLPARRNLFSPSQYSNSAELHRYRARHSSTGSSSCASTVLHEDDADNAEDASRDDSDQDSDGEAGGTVVDENESVENGQLSPFSSPTLDKLRVSPYKQQQQNAVVSEEAWNTLI